MVPKAALPNDPFGSFKGGVLPTLNAAVRNSKFTRSDNRNVFADRVLPGSSERRRVEPLRSPSICEVMQFGRCTAYPKAGRLFAACVIGAASPACKTHQSCDLSTGDFPTPLKLINPSRRKDSTEPVLVGPRSPAGCRSDAPRNNGAVPGRADSGGTGNRPCKALSLDGRRLSRFC